MFDFVHTLFGGTSKRQSLVAGAPTQDINIQGSSNQERVVQARPEKTPQHISVLVLGRFGSDKAMFIDNARLAEGQGAGTSSRNSTTSVVSTRASRFGQNFKLIDTPGFDNPATSDSSVFTEIAKYLLDKKRVNEGITGLVYIHHAGDPLESRALARNIAVLSEVFFGTAGLSRLTIFVVPASSRRSQSESVARSVSRPGSAFAAAIRGGAKVRISSLDQTDVDYILRSYASMEPLLLHIQQTALQDPRTDFGGQIEEHLGYCENDTAKRRLNEREQQYRDQYGGKLKTLQTSLHEAQSHASQVSDSLKMSEEHIASQRSEIVTLRRQFQQTQSEYASLRSQLQLQENTEQSDIVQSLKDLNRDIDDIGRSISEYLVDNYVQTVFGKDQADVTALDARHLPALVSLLGHVEGQSSLIASSDGAGMGVEDFFDYSVRFLLCRCLCQWVFGPFHPGVDSTRSKCVAEMYEDVQQRGCGRQVACEQF
ncbi:hypothetical protein BDV93DRAFT_326063 [Ceratobasidium sp. AG-I]|nr:hypothetical protein BDV93DRAFT_326063 [Ceratobasidium sp. AG-I]